MSTTSLGLSTASSGSGIDVDAVVSAMIEAERAPERIWQAQRQLLQIQASALSDINSKLGSLESTVTDLRDVVGIFSESLATSSDGSVLTATATSGATATTHSIKITSLASNALYYSNALASSSSIIASGSFTIKAGTAEAKVVTIDATNNTLEKLAGYINELGLDVRANVVTDANGARLSIAGTKTGKANDVQLSAVDGFTFTAASSADNAKLTVDGVPVESATNNVSGAIAGVTLQLHNVSPTLAVTINVAPDTARITQAVQDFVSRFNSLMSAVNSQFIYDPVNKTAGALASDSTVRTLQEQMLRSISFSTSSMDAVATLASLGVSMENDGTLSFDNSKFQSLIQTNFDGVKSFFQGTKGDGTGGFANTLAAVIDGLNDSTTGAIVVDLKGNTASQQAIADQIEDFEVRIENRRLQLLNQYSQVDAILRQFPLTQSRVSSQLDSLNGLKK